MNTTTKTLLAAAAMGTVGLGSVSAQVTEYTAGGLTSSWLDGGNWDAGIPNSLASVALVSIPGGPDLSGSATVDSVNVSTGSSIEVSLASTLTVAGPLSTNNGVIDLNRDNSTANSVLLLPNTTTFTGSGAIRLFTNADNAQIAGTGMLINGLAHTISGEGQINVEWLNQGFIRADLGNGIRVLEIRADGENQGLLSAVQTASGGSNLEIRGASIVQTGVGSMSASDGGQIELFGGTSITGGTLTTIGGGFFDTTPGVVTFTDVTNNGDLFIDASTTLHVLGSGLLNNGSITLNNQNSTANGVVSFEESGTLGGTGEMILRVSADNSQLNTAEGVTISHAASHTVRGVGQVNASIDNAGVIAADNAVSFGTTTLELQTNNKTNSGLLEARTASVLNIEAIEIDQASEGVSVGRIEANDGTVSFFGLASVLGGNVTSSGTGTVGVRSSSDTTFDNVNLNADFFVDASGTLIITSGLINNGSITVNNQNSSANAEITTEQAVSIEGNGTIVFRTGSSNSFMTTSGAGQFVLGAGQLLTGSGDLDGSFVNNGVIAADLAASFGAGPMQLDVGPFVNNNLMTAEPGSNLDIRDVLVTQDPGASIESNDGLVTIGSNSRIENGSLDSIGTGLFRTFTAGSRDLSGITLNGQLQIDASHTVRVDSAGLVNNGLIEINRNNSSADANLDLADAMISGTGEIQLRTGSSNSFIRTDAGTTGTIGSGQLVRGAGFITGDIINNGVCAGDVSVTVSGNTIVINTDSFVNNNMIVAETGSGIDVSGTGIDQSGGGDMLAKDGGSIEFLGTTGVTGGTLSSEGSGTWIINGDVDVAGTQLGGTGQIDASDALRVIGTTLNNDAFITVNPQNSSADAVILIEDDQETTLSGTGTMDFRTAGFGNGRISPTTVGADQGTLVNGPGHTLAGLATIQVDTTNEGSITVGRPFGEFITNNVLTFAPGSEMNVTIGLNAQNGQLDVLASGHAVLGGTLNVSLAAGQVLTNNFNHIIVDGPYSGTFDTENVLVDGQLITRVRYENEQVVLRTRCQADTNLDGTVDPSDFNAWILAFNSNDPVADQNLDGLVSPADFNAWILNFNSGC